MIDLAEHEIRLHNPARLAALHRLELLDSATDPDFDRLARLTTAVIKVPVALISLVDADRQFLKSCPGMAEPWASQRETPLSHSICQYVVTTGTPLIIPDTRREPLLQGNRSIPELNAIAYAGIPLYTADGAAIGTLCVIDHKPRTWTPSEIVILHDLAAAVSTEVKLRYEHRERRKVDREREALMAAQAITIQRMEALYRTGRALMDATTLADVFRLVVASAVDSLHADRVALITLDQEQQQVLECVTGGPGAAQIGSVTWAELQEGLSGWAMREHQPVVSRKGRADPRETMRVQTRRATIPTGSVIVAPLLSRGAILGTITAINCPDDPDFTPDDGIFLASMASQAAATIQNMLLFERIQVFSQTDMLTGLLNRHGFQTMSGHELQRLARCDGRYSLIMVDIDHFKRINDEFGHAAGDDILREVARRAQKSLRGADIISRHGGEEFLILLPEADLEGATAVAEHLRMAVSAQPMGAEATPVLVTISLGVAGPYSAAQSLEAAAEDADGALYAAKAAGRNCWVVHGIPQGLNAAHIG